MKRKLVLVTSFVLWTLFCYAPDPNPIPMDESSYTLIGSGIVLAAYQLLRKKKDKVAK